MESIYEVASRTDVSAVWSGNPVGFSRVEDDEHEYLAYYDPHRQLTVARRRKGEPEWQVQKLDEIVALDAHNSAALGIDPEGHLHLTANMHVVPLNYWRTSSPGDIHSFIRLDVMTGSDEKRVTYPRFFHDAKGRLYFKYRDGASGNGVELVNVYDQSGQWQRFLAEPLLDGKALMNAYQTGPLRGPDGKFHLAWVWRNTPRVETNHDLSYAVSTDLEHWQTADGESLKLPIVLEDDCHVDRVKTREGMLNRIHIGFDRKHQVVLTYIKFDTDGDTQVHAARRSETGWQITQVTDWVSRWDMQAQGSIPTVMDFGAITPYLDSGYLQLRVANKQVFGDMMPYMILLDERTLEPVTDPIGMFPDHASLPQSAIEGMRVNRIEWREDDRLYWYRWETLDAARDVVHDLDWVPKNLQLELLTFKMHMDPLEKVGQRSAIGSSAVRKQRHRRLKAWFNELQITTGANGASLDDIQQFAALAEQGQIVEAASRLRRWVRENVDFRKQPTHARKLSAAELTVAEEMRWHQFNWHGLYRELSLEIGDWWPFPDSLLQAWTLQRRETDAYREASAEELQQAFGPIWLWYQELHGWTHLLHLAEAYHSTQNVEYARQWAHDFIDYRYHNIAPEQPTSIGPWGLQVVWIRLDRMLDMVYQLVDAEEISDTEFTILISSLSEHTAYLRAAQQLEHKGSSDQAIEELLQEVSRRFKGMIRR